MFTFSFCLTVIRPWLKLPTGGHGQVICMGNLRGVFSQENTPEGHTETHKSDFFPYKQVSRRNGDHEWFRMTNAFILCDLLWKVQKRHAANRENSFKMINNMFFDLLFTSGRANQHIKVIVFSPSLELSKHNNIVK